MQLQAVDDHRDQILAITDAASTDLSGYVSTILSEDPVQVAAQARAASNAVVSTYGDVAATTGALFYEVNRPKPGFTAELMPPTLGDALAGQLGWALLPVFRPEEFPNGPLATLDRLAGVMQKAVAEADRSTIAEAARVDKLSQGVRRFAAPGACAFCAYMTSTVGGSRAHWHDHCHCVTVPSWLGESFPGSKVQDAYDRATSEAIRTLDQLRTEHPDWGSMKPSTFLRAHPELRMVKKNILRVMREQGDFAH